MQGRHNPRTWELLRVARAPDADWTLRREALERAASRIFGYSALAVAGLAVCWSAMLLF